MTKIYAWQRSYQDALLEMDPTQMRTKLSRAFAELEQRNRKLMFQRDAESLREMQAIADACNGLRAVEKSELTVPVEVVSQQRSIAT
ncbi:MAG: hypothetical protein WBV46_20360 [Terriglobales bacterium]|jgi:hypothetical protein